eukprot:722834-Prymnesium_polylepis.1
MRSCRAAALGTDTSGSAACVSPRPHRRASSTLSAPLPRTRGSMPWQHGCRAARFTSSTLR